jgi:dCMP deaminase
MQRPSKNEYYLNIARQVAQRATCLRRRYGAVIVKDDQIVATGYTGAPRGVNNCDQLGQCERQKQKVPAGQRYELCRSVHAEMNAVIHASRQQTLGSILYLHGDDLTTGQAVADPQPCQLCRRVIINAGIVQVVTFQSNGSIKTTMVEDWVQEENQAAVANLSR